MKSLTKWFMLLMLISTLALVGCEGDDGDDGAPGAPGAPGADGTDGMSAYDIAVANGYTGTYEEYAALVTPNAAAAVEPESCAVCHAGVGDKHQSVYDMYADESNLLMTFTDYFTAPVVNSALVNATVTFTVTQDGMTVEDLTEFPQKRLYTVGYDDEAGKFDNSLGFSINPIATAGEFTATAQYNSAELEPGFPVTQVYGYVANGDLGLGTGHINLYDNVSNAGFLDDSKATEYMSAANETGCQKCHGGPEGAGYMKHGYRGALAGDLGEFAACKACHYDSRDGGHILWQMMADVPVRAAEIELGNATETPADEERYAYIANVMNDTHMSHAMEFPYPQTMANCNACHEGKLDMVLTADNFNLTTCKSCHPVQGNPDYPSMAPPLVEAIPAIHGFTAEQLYQETTIACTNCHGGGDFAGFHPGYNPVVNYNETDKYSEAITVDITSATYNATTMNMEITADVTTDGFDATKVELGAAKWGLYAYDSDDLLASRLDATTAADDGYISNASAAGLTWTMNADLSAFADQIDAGNVNRAQIMIQPRFYNADGDMVALNAPTEIIELADGSFDAPVNFVDTDKCNVCHDALGITFHSPDRGGNIEACKTCHVVTSGGSHLEMQSRSIDSYVHAIHSFQPFDYGDIDFNDPVEAAHYNLETEAFVFPTFTTLSCEACHNSGKYNVPDQSVSLAAQLSASDSNDTTTRNIGDIPSVIVGPASNACGGCHRATLINEDDANGLTAFDQHAKQFGYRVEEDDGVQATIWQTIQSYFD